MNKFNFRLLVLASMFFSVETFASEPDILDIDSTRKVVHLDEVYVFSQYKENSETKQLPVSFTQFSTQRLNSLRVNSLKDLSVNVPNFFVPDYGSKVTSTIYVRGIGSRINSPSIGFYVDNIPFIDKTTFDYEFDDVDAIEVLRGPQGTLYGRNTMAGIVNIKTRSPFDYQGSKITLSAADYGEYKAKFRTSHKINDHLAFSLSGNYNSSDGFFKNIYTGKKADQSKYGGGRLKLSWRPTDSLTIDFTSQYENTDQDGYPYGRYNKATGKISDVNYNDPSSYWRSVSTNGAFLQYRGRGYIMSSSLSYQFFKDKMLLDQDFSPMSIFSMEHYQKQNSFNPEITFRSNNSNRYQWVFGASGFYQSLNTDSPVIFKKNGIENIIESVFQDLYDSGRMPLLLKVKENQFEISGNYKTPSHGVALYHQSTMKDVFTKGLSVTAGIRGDYQKVKIKHNTFTEMTLYGNMQAGPVIRPVEVTIDPEVSGKERQDWLQFLPKIAVKYDFNEKNSVYASAAKGYKAGGYNIQMFSSIIQKLMMKSPMAPPSDTIIVKDYITYKPEYTWNYEIGYRSELVDNTLWGDFTVFYINYRDQQITVFAPQGLGRMMRNAGRSESKGFEASLRYKPMDNMNVYASYGYTDAKFIVNNDGRHNYKGNYTPMTPRHTLSLSSDYTFMFSDSKILDAITLMANYNAQGRIYWTENNEISQPFYGILTGSVEFTKDIFKLKAWGKNLAKQSYQAFYFESENNSFIQKGRPLQVGVDLTVSF